MIELLVVIAIIAILLKVAVPRMARLMTHYRLDGAARSLMADLQKVRLRAVSENQCFRVKFTSPVAVGSYRVEKKAATSDCTSDTGYVQDTLLDSGDKRVDDANSLTVSASANPVFNARGTAQTPATITLTTGLSSSRQVLVQSSGRIAIN